MNGIYHILKEFCVSGLLHDSFREEWLLRLLEMSPEELDLFCQSSGAHPASGGRLQRNLKGCSVRTMSSKRPPSQHSTTWWKLWTGAST